LFIGGHQLRLRCGVPQGSVVNTSETPLYDEFALDQAPYIPCASILVRLLPYTKEPIFPAPYRERCYRSAESKPIPVEWKIYRLFESDNDKDVTFRRVIRELLMRENVKTDREYRPLFNQLIVSVIPV
uniref:PAZ domain-containing protein n=1 Tax=Echinostoma caproni TaxID=27848 RepID=A0A183B228_9TREM